MEGEPSGSLILMFLGALVFFAHLFQAVFKRFRIPDTLWLMGIGMLLGPFTHIVSAADFGLAGTILTEVALVVILFEAGLELKWKQLKPILGSAMVLTAAVYFSVAVAIALLLHYAGGFPLEASIFGGAVLAAPSPPVIIPILRGLPISEDLKVMLTLESAVGEALGLVAALAVLQVVELEDPDFGKMVGAILSAFVVAVALGIAFGGAWMLCLSRIREMKNSMVLTPAIVFILFGLTDYLGFSGPIAALSFGLTLSNAPAIAGAQRGKMTIGDTSFDVSGVNDLEMKFLGELVFMLKTFFFVFLGLNIGADDLWSSLGLAAVGVLFLVRLVVVRTCIASRLPDQKSGVLLASLIPKGLAAAVLAGAGATAPDLQMGEELENLIYSVILYSILITALVVFAIERLGFWRLFGWIFPKNRDPEP